MLDATKAGTIEGEVSLVITNQPDAFALTRAERAGVPRLFLSHKGHPKREDYDALLVSALREASVDLVVLAGFLKPVLHIKIKRNYKLVS